MLSTPNNIRVIKSRRMRWVDMYRRGRDEKCIQNFARLEVFPAIVRYVTARYHNPEDRNLVTKF